MTATYQTGVGDLIDPTTPTVDIIDADGLELVTNATPTRISLGNYSYAYVVPALGPIGVWHAHWGGTIDGADAGGDDWFDVVAPGDILLGTYNLLTLAEAKAALNIAVATTTFDTEIGSYIAAVSERLDDLCGPIIKRSISAEPHNSAPVVWPDRAPVATVGAITEYRSGVATVLSAETVSVSGDYLFENGGTHNSLIRPRAGWADRPGFTGASIAIDYVAGRFNSTADVSQKFKQAAAIYLSHMWRKEQGAGTVTFGSVETNELGVPTFGVPNVVKDLLELEIRPPGVG